MTWYAQALLATMFMATAFLLVKRASLAHIPVNTLTFYIWVIAAIILYGYMTYERESLRLSSTQLIIVICTAIAFLLGALLLNNSVYNAPNPGYATAVGSAQIVLVLFLSVLLFGAQITWIKTVGTFFVMLGVVLLAF